MTDMQVLVVCRALFKLSPHTASWGKPLRRPDQEFDLRVGPGQLEAHHPLSCPWNMPLICLFHSQKFP